MDSKIISPETTEERIVWHAIRGTYVFYLFGALYVVAPVIAWILLAMFVRRYLLCEYDKLHLVNDKFPFAIWLWIIGMLVMLLALIVGHLDFALGMGSLVKSTIGWAKGWALLAIFPLLGMLKIRPEIIYRASMHVCFHTLLLLPLFIGAWLFGAPETLYVSPLQIIGGPGPEFFAVSLYEIEPGSGSPRWRLFTPWAPAIGFVANIFFIFSLKEQNMRWKLIGIVGSITMVLLSGSRLALLALILTWLTTSIIIRLRSPFAPFISAIGISLLGLISVPVLDAIDRFWQAFRSARAGSTRVRETLANIAVERWQSEAPVWGHGVVERGPHLVEYMPIGSHHSWYGLLFVKGLVGFLALAIPLCFALLQLTWWSAQLSIARVGLALMMLLFLYTFGENLEILAYLIWPALLVTGIAHRDIAIAAEKTATLQNLNSPFPTRGNIHAQS